MIPNRLTARDLRLQLEWLQNEWDDVWANEKRLARFRRLLEHVGEPHRTDILQLVDELGRSQLVAGDQHHQIIRRIHILVNRWDRSRHALDNQPPVPEGAA